MNKHVYFFTIWHFKLYWTAVHSRIPLVKTLVQSYVLVVAKEKKCSCHLQVLEMVLYRLQKLLHVIVSLLWTCWCLSKFNFLKSFDVCSTPTLSSIVDVLMRSCFFSIHITKLLKTELLTEVTFQSDCSSSCSCFPEQPSGGSGQRLHHCLRCGSTGWVSGLRVKSQLTWQAAVSKDWPEIILLFVCVCVRAAERVRQEKLNIVCVPTSFQVCCHWCFLQLQWPQSLLANDKL